MLRVARGDSTLTMTFCRPTAIAQSFIFPDRVASLSVTQTTHGISSRALLGEFEVLDGEKVG